MDVPALRRRLWEDGFVVAPGALAPGDVERLRAGLVRRAPSLDVDGEVRRLAWRDRSVRTDAVVRDLHRLADDLAGHRTYLYFDHLIRRAPGGSDTTRWHQDHGYFALGRVRTAIHVWVPLQDVPDELGPLRYVPTAHPAPVLAHERVPGSSRVVLAVDPQDAVACPVALGDVIVHLPGTPHASSPNAGTVDRWSWTLQFRPWWSMPPARLAGDALRGRRRIVSPR